MKRENKIVHISDKSKTFDEITAVVGSNKKVPKTKITLFLERKKKIDNKNILFPEEAK